jgi:hypothetical protein
MQWTGGDAKAGERDRGVVAAARVARREDVHVVAQKAKTIRP